MEYLCMDICDIDSQIEKERIDEDSYDLSNIQFNFNIKIYY